MSRTSSLHCRSECRLVHLASTSSAVSPDFPRCAQGAQLMEYAAWSLDTDTVHSTKSHPPSNLPGNAPQELTHPIRLTSLPPASNVLSGPWQAPSQCFPDGFFFFKKQLRLYVYIVKRACLVPRRNADEPSTAPCEDVCQWRQLAEGQHLRPRRTHQTCHPETVMPLGNGTRAPLH